MRTIDELGISKTPWRLGSLVIGSDGLLARSSVDDDDDGVVAGDLLIKEADARLISAAPELYECLREAVEDKCEVCKNSWYGNCVTKDGSPCGQVKKWRNALAKASGEEER